MKTWQVLGAMVLSLATAGIIVNDAYTRKAAREQARIETAGKNHEYSANFLTQNINKIAVYTRFGNRDGMSYETFCKVTGIRPELGDKYKDCQIYVNIMPSGTDITQRVAGENDNSVSILIPLDTENKLNILGKVTKYDDDFHGVKPLGLEDLTNPPGGY